MTNGECAPLAVLHCLFWTSRTAVRKAPAEVSGVCLLFITSTYLHARWAVVVDLLQALEGVACMCRHENPILRCFQSALQGLNRGEIPDENASQIMSAESRYAILPWIMPLHAV